MAPNLTTQIWCEDSWEQQNSRRGQSLIKGMHVSRACKEEASCGSVAVQAQFRLQIKDIFPRSKCRRKLRVGQQVGWRKGDLLKILGILVPVIILAAYPSSPMLRMCIIWFL